MKSTRFTDSKELRDQLKRFNFCIQGLVDTLISMFLSGEIGSEKIRERYHSRHEGIIVKATKTLLKNRYKK